MSREVNWKGNQDDRVVCSSSYRAAAVEAGLWSPAHPRVGSIPRWVRDLWDHHPECRPPLLDRMLLRYPSASAARKKKALKRLNTMRVEIARRAQADEEEKRTLLMEAKMARTSKIAQQTVGDVLAREAYRRMKEGPN